VTADAKAAKDVMAKSGGANRDVAEVMSIMKERREGNPLGQFEATPESQAADLEWAIQVQNRLKGQRTVDTDIKVNQAFQNKPVPVTMPDGSTKPMVFVGATNGVATLKDPTTGHEYKLPTGRVFSEFSGGQ
jgi:hypothetical protein